MLKTKKIVFLLMLGVVVKQISASDYSGSATNKSGLLARCGAVVTSAMTTPIVNLPVVNVDVTGARVVGAAVAVAAVVLGARQNVRTNSYLPARLRK